MLLLFDQINFIMFGKYALLSTDVFPSNITESDTTADVSIYQIVRVT